MQTPYIPHLFGPQALTETRKCSDWLTSFVVSSIPWPEDDVWVLYDGEQFFLQGVLGEGEKRNSPAISTPVGQGGPDAALARLYRFASILGYFKRGYVDITASFESGYVMRGSGSYDAFATITQGGRRRFSCNYMPVIEDDQIRKALGFLREGRRLRHVHEPYSFLSFFKVIESQFAADDRVAWIEQNLNLLQGEAAARITKLRQDGVEVNRHLYDSGRCAIAHASLSGTIVDPDIPRDRRRIAEDLVVIEALANQYIKVKAGVPDDLELYGFRDRLTPWHPLIPSGTREALMTGAPIKDGTELGRLNDAEVSIRLWPDEPPRQFQGMKFHSVASAGGRVKFVALNPRKSIALVFLMDVPAGRLHAVVEEGGMDTTGELTEQDVENYTRYFHSVLGNRLVEVAVEGVDPVPCEIVIPHNIIPRSPEEAVAEALLEFRQRKGAMDGIQDVGPNRPGSLGGSQPEGTSEN